MARVDFTSPRLFHDADLAAGTLLALAREQGNYLLNVLRLRTGDVVLVFNGRQGEWRARIEAAGRRDAGLRIEERVREQPAADHLVYAFAPLKQARLDYMVQKAVEMGAGELQPVLTQHTQVSRLNLDRVRANAIEAAEQCGVLALPEIRPLIPLGRWLAERRHHGPLVFCDEDATVAGPIAALRAAAAGAPAVLIGPEGGFSEAERATLLARPDVVRLSLGPRILRADTAAVAALTLVQAVLGDFAGGPQPAA